MSGQQSVFQTESNDLDLRLSISPSAGFGIAVTLIGVLNNALVTELQAIGSIEILTLIGIGLGVGSLKEIVDRD